MSPKPRKSPVTTELVTIGASLGGAQAIKKVLKCLPADFAVPIAIAQHRHKTSGEILSQYFQRSTRLKVVDADDNMPIEESHVYLAPADYHIVIGKGVIRLSVDEPVHYSRPSIDVLFETAADAYRNRLIGVVLTGANADGAEGARVIRRRGGVVIVQDPETAEAPVMPSAALPAATRVVKLGDLGDAIAEFAARNR